MKIICPKNKLLDAINVVQKAVSTKSTLPILEGILLEVSDKFKLSANDLEIAIEYIVGADIRRTGATVINSKMFGDVVRRMPDADLLIEMKDNHLVIIECEHCHFELKGMSPQGFPSVPEIKAENSIDISQKTLKEMIKQTIFAVGSDENRPILTGALIEIEEQKITMVAVDGFRMAIRNIEEKGAKHSFNVVIPGKALNEISKIAQSVDEPVKISIALNQIMFEFQNCLVVSRILEGDFLNYRNLLPKEHETKIRINVKDLLSSIERASLISMEEKKYPVKFNIDLDKIIISSNTDIGAVREEISIETSGNKIEIGFNPRYFIETLKAIEDEKIDIYFTSSVGPTTIRPVEGISYSYMILPVRIKND